MKKMLSAFLVIMSLENIVCASNVSTTLPTIIKPDPILPIIIKLIEIFLYVFSFGLIVHTIIKFIKLKASEKEAVKNGEEIKKKRFKYAFVVKK